jgi:hypothetical protein
VPSLQKAWVERKLELNLLQLQHVQQLLHERNNQLSLLDDKFDRFMEQYGKLEEGALEGEEIEGTKEEGGGRMQDETVGR